MTAWQQDHAGQFGWPCGMTTQHEPHPMTGDGHYGYEGYRCDGSPAVLRLSTTIDQLACLLWANTCGVTYDWQPERIKDAWCHQTESIIILYRARAEDAVKLMSQL